MSGDADFLKPLMREGLGGTESERTEGRLGDRSGYYNQALIMRVVKLELRVPQARQGRFRTAVLTQ